MGTEMWECFQKNMRLYANTGGLVFYLLGPRELGRHGFNIQKSISVFLRVLFF